MPVNVSFSVGFSLVQQVHFSLFQIFLLDLTFIFLPSSSSRFFKEGDSSTLFPCPFSPLKKSPFINLHICPLLLHFSLNKRFSVPLDLPYNLFAPGERQSIPLLARLDQQQLYFFARRREKSCSQQYAHTFVPTKVSSIFYILSVKRICRIHFFVVEAFYFRLDQIFDCFSRRRGRWIVNGS